MTPGYKEKIIMHSIYPKKINAFEDFSLHYLHYYACLFDLAAKNIFRIENNQMFCNNTETGDPVLDMVISMLVPLSGKKTLRLQLLVAQKAQAVYKKQIELMLASDYLRREDIVFISWKVGNKYSVRKPDLLKQGITKLERALVYGRKPDRDTWLFTLLVGEGNLFGNIFTTREFRERAKQRYMEFRRSERYEDDITISALIKTLRKTIKTKKAVGVVAKS
jgi:hypothetical protein